MVNLTDSQIIEIATREMVFTSGDLQSLLRFARDVEKAAQDAMRRNTEMTLRGNEAASNKHISNLEAQIKELRAQKWSSTKNYMTKLKISTIVLA